MFGISHSPESDSLAFGGLIDTNNKDRLLSFLS